MAPGVRAQLPGDRSAAQSGPPSDETPRPWVHQIEAKKAKAQAPLAEEKPLEVSVAALEMQREYKSIEAKELVILSCKQQSHDPNL